MNEAEYARIYAECDAFRARLCVSAEQTPEAMLYVATCLLMQVQAIHRVVGGHKLDAALLYAAADNAAGRTSGE